MCLTAGHRRLLTMTELGPYFTSAPREDLKLNIFIFISGILSIDFFLFFEKQRGGRFILILMNFYQ